VTSAVRQVLSQWGAHGPRPVPWADNDDLFARMVVSVSTDIDCPPDQAWALVTDVTRIAEFSPECVKARWMDTDGLKVGARFEGTNAKVMGVEQLTWIRPCTVTVVEPGETFGYVVGDRYDGSPAGVWAYDLRGIGAGCRLQLTFRHEPKGLSGLRLAADADPAHAAQLVVARTAELTGGMRTSLERIKDALQSAVATITL